MSIKDFISQTTIERTGGAIPMAKLRKDFIARFGGITRAEFLAETVAAGFLVAVPAARPSYLVGRALTPAGVQ
jgi:hypothetical protein